MRCWVLQTGEWLPYIHEDARPMRSANVVHALAAAGHHVTLWAADFIHQSGSHLYGRHTIYRPAPNVEIRLVHTRGYSRNVGPERLLDHAQLGWRLRRMLRDEKPPDVAFIGFPPIEPAAVMSRWLKARGVPMLLDVKDQWPEVLVRPVPSAAQPLARSILAPYFRASRHALRNADALASISDDFLDWSVEFAGRERTADDLVLPLTAPRPAVTAAELESAEKFWDSHGVSDDDAFTVSYVGSINSGLDLAPVFDCADDPDIRFVLCGSGPALEPTREASTKRPNIVLPGWVNRAQAQVLARRSSVAIAPYIDEEGFRLGIPNKAYDAMAQGLPFVTSISGAVERLINVNGIGVHYGRPGSPTLSEALASLRMNPGLLESQSENARRLYETRFSAEVVYGDLVRRMEQMGLTG